MTKAEVVSDIAKTTGIDKETTLAVVEAFMDSGYFHEKRQRQAKWWMYESINEALRSSFYLNKEVQALRPQVEQQVLGDELSSFIGAQRLLECYFASLGARTELPTELS